MKKIILVLPIFFIMSVQTEFLHYLWLKDQSGNDTILSVIGEPKDYERTLVESGCFADWLRHLPLKKGKPPVRLYNGRIKGNQNGHYAVLNIDVGDRNLQQCADAIIRLRAEYLFQKKDFVSIHFNFTDGSTARFDKWAQGYRPSFHKKRPTTWEKIAHPDYSYFGFREYLNNVFLYAGTISLDRELVRVKKIAKMGIGDIFIQKGSPGHAVIVVDMAKHRTTGKKVFLLAQSFMPAQDVHVLLNPNNDALGPWYPLEFKDTLITPEWVFKKTDLKRFR